MPFFAQDFQTLTADSVNDLVQNTNITKLSSGGMARALLESVNKRLETAYETFDLNLARAFVSAAPGQYLELIGALLGVAREPSESASIDEDTQALKFYVSSGTFGDINSGNDIVIPQGTLISTQANNGGIVYRTTAEYTLSSGASYKWISAEAQVPGTTSNIGSNSLVFHSFTNYTSYTDISSPLLITNIYPIANGKDVESDGNYRYRIVNRVLEAEAANLTAIRLAVLITPGVADAVLVPRYRGIGTIGILLKATLPVVSQTLIDAVQANVQEVMAAGDIAYVRRPQESGLTMKLTVYYKQRLPSDDLDIIEDTLKEVITEYVNSLDIGEVFYINHMISELFAVDDNIVNIGTYTKPVDELYIHKESYLQDNKVRQTLLGDYVPASDERIIIEPSVSVPITIARAYSKV